jgi:hypothetical protein
MRLIDADAFDKVLKDAQTECKKNGGNFRFGVLNNVRANLAKAPTIGGWISVKHRLPEDETVVIAYVQHKIGWYRMFAWHDMYGWHSSAPEFDDKESDYVTHWMPLPEPPKVGDDE